MITFKDKDSTFIKIEYDNQSEFERLYSYFSIPIPGAEFSQHVRAGLSDGKKKFITAKGYLLWGLKDKAIQFCETENIEYQDETTPIENDFNIKEFMEFYNKLDLPFKPYEHQLKGVVLSLQQKRGCYLLSTGSGKSLCLYILCRWFISKNLKQLVLVPNIDLVNQLSDDFKDYFYTKENKLKEQLETEQDELKIASIKKQLNQIYQNRKDLNCKSIEKHTHLIFGGQEKNTNKLVKISTRDSLSINQDRVNTEYFKDIDVFIGDEIHRIGNETSSMIVKECSKSKDMYKLGYTGSLSDDIINNLLVEGLIGKVNTIIRMRELIDLGMATNILIKPLYLNYNEQITKEVKKMKWQEEDKYIRNFIPRNKFIAQLATSFKDKNIMIVYKNIDCAEAILKEIVQIKDPSRPFKVKDYQKENDLGIYISKGDTKAKNRNAFRGYLENGTGKIWLGTDKIISTGINVKNLHCFIFAQIGKESTKLIQALGRVGRLHDSKENAEVFDIVDNLVYTVKRSGNQYPNYYFKHWNERLNIYTREEFEVQEPIPIQLNLEDTLF